MAQQKIYDVAIIGGGIVGTATAMSLQEIGIQVCNCSRSRK